MSFYNSIHPTNPGNMVEQKPMPGKRLAVEFLIGVVKSLGYGDIASYNKYP